MTLKLEGIQRDIFLQRYAMPDETEWQQCAHRVAAHVAQHEINGNVSKWTKHFSDSIGAGDFMPGGRILFGAGRRQFNMLNCYAIGIDDTVESIGKAISDNYKISCDGGGIGFNFSSIRPKGDNVRGIKYAAPGAVSVIKMINEIGEHVRSGGSRRTALIAILNVTHPDLFEFLHVKLDLKQLNNFNISIGITNEFIEAVRKNKFWTFHFNSLEYKTYQLTRISKNDHEVIKIPAINEEDALGRANNHYRITQDDTFEDIKEYKLPAREIWDTMIINSWKSGDPGIYNLSLSNSFTNVSYFEKLEQPNPCVAEGTLVNTPNGYRRVETLHVGENVSTILGCEPIKTIEKHNNVPVYKIRFSDGGEQVATAAHIYHSFSTTSSKISLKRLDELKIGDFVRIQTTPLQDSNNQHDYEIGLKQGILLGDGSITGTAKKISSNIEDVLYNTNVKELFGNDNFIKDCISKNSKSVNLNFGKEYSTCLLTDLDLEANYAESKFIPESSINNYRRGLGVIDGLLATDGNILLKSKTPQVRLTTCSKRMANDIRRLCLNLGIHARVYSSMYDDGGMIDGRIIKRKNTRYDVHIMADSLMKFASISRLEEIHPKKGNKLKSILKDYCLVSGTYRAKILSIEPFGESTVYDIYCEKSDTWITEGYVNRGCGEIPLPPFGNCCLGHVNLSNMYDEEKNDVNWKKMATTIRTGIRFLDNVLSVNSYPIPECKTVGERSRRIGLGVTGLHYLLLKLGYRYGDEKCLEFLDRLFATFRDEAYKASIELAKEKGSFPAFDADKYSREEFFKQLPARIQASIKKFGIRNAVMLTIAPCGTNSMVLGVSSGIEPIFAPIYKRRYRDGNIWREEYVADMLFSKYFTDNKDMTHFCGAYDISVEQHISVQATIQKYIDSAISKTTNLPNDYDCDKLSSVILDYAQHVKGFTIYRAGSKGNEPLEPIDISNSEKLETAMSMAGMTVQSIEACRNGSCEL